MELQNNSNQLSREENEKLAGLIPMGSVTGVYDQQMINQAANLDNANMEAERRRRALKSQGATRPNKNARRTNI